MLALQATLDAQGFADLATPDRIFDQTDGQAGGQTGSQTYRILPAMITVAKTRKPLSRMNSASSMGSLASAEDVCGGGGGGGGSLRRKGSATSLCSNSSAASSAAGLPRSLSSASLPRNLSSTSLCSSDDGGGPSSPAPPAAAGQPRPPRPDPAAVKAAVARVAEAGAALSEAMKGAGKDSEAGDGSRTGGEGWSNQGGRGGPS